jgi:hypothetical protein
VSRPATKESKGENVLWPSERVLSVYVFAYFLRQKVRPAAGKELIESGNKNEAKSPIKEKANVTLFYILM